MSRSHEYQRPACRLGLVAAVVVTLVTAVPAAAQEDDPYGGTTTTTEQPRLVPTCELGLTAGAPGTEATVTVTNVPPGGTVRILVGGTEVARATSPVEAQPTGTPVLFGGEALVGGQGSGTMEIPFTVPDLPPGRYLVTAVGADFTLTCGPDDGRLEVLAASESRGTGVSALPRTGAYVALFVVVGLVLLLAGRALVKSSARQRKAAVRRGPSADGHLVDSGARTGDTG